MTDDASSAERAAGWRPIGTAPRVKVDIILGRPSKVMVGRWYKDGIPGFYSNDVGPDDIGPDRPATHWQPLPAPPDPQEHLARRGR